MSETDLKKLTVAQLKKLCKEKGIKVPSKARKAEIIKLILESGLVKEIPKEIQKPSPNKKKKTKKSSSSSKASKEEGTIKQGTIAQFMRKRTQLVGFEYGYNKHTQYCAEFLDNALDAIESYQWKQKREDGPYKFTLDQELSLENLSILQLEDESDEDKSQQLNDDAKHSLRMEIGIDPTESAEIKETEEIEENIVDEVIDKDEIEVEEEVKTIIENMEEIIKPVEDIIDIEPIVIMRIKETEPPSFLTAELSKKNVMLYSFEIFDNGTGMPSRDLKKFGRYLASSKSLELKQTRGSQGFGAPSAFSDAQNTTGKPIIAVSKSISHIYATISEFFTTSKNEKKYVVAPTEADCPFLHGTYIKLNYLNIKYNRGFVDTYVKETALMNPHITIIFIDPYNEQFIYPRKVSSFPLEPKYAKPHPSSTNIGDLQDLLAKSENLTLSAFLQDNFVRVSSRTAKEILDLAERDLQDKLGLLITKNGYLTLADKKSDDIYFLKFEERIYGKSKKPRDKLIIYKVESEELLKKYWEIISEYNKFIKKNDKIDKEIIKINNQIDKTETKKEAKALEKEIRALQKEIDVIRDEKDKLRKALDNLFKDTGEGIVEQKKFKNRTDFEELVEQVEISKTRPMNINSDQFNSLFLAFKSVKYMAPPTDTAIPVGDTILENTLIKELGLQISENLDDFDFPEDNIKKTSEIIFKQKKREIERETGKVSKEVLKNINIEQDEIVDISSQILASMYRDEELSEDGVLSKTVDQLLTDIDVKTTDVYSEVFDYFLNTFSRDDDFVAAETRNPTSGKGLAYVVEGVMAYSKNLETPKRSHDVLSRFVNRTPKLRDTADCAITEAVRSVNWKNYKLDTFDNGLPKGPIKVLVNVSGPYVHLMFKSQSKNSLAGDEELEKEIKQCLEAIGRRFRIYINRRQTQRKREERGKKILKYIPKFVHSLYNIASQGESIFKSKVDEGELISLMEDAINKKDSAGKALEQMKEDREKAKELQEKKEKLDIKKEEVKAEKEKPEIKEVEKEKVSKVEKEPAKALPKMRKFTKKTLQNWNKDELIDYCKKNTIRILSKDTKADIISKILTAYETPEEFETEKPAKPISVAPGTIKAKTERLREAKGEAPVTAVQETKVVSASKVKPAAPPKPKQTTLPLITTEKILDALSKDWQPITKLIFKLKIKDMMDARFLQIKLKELERKGKVIVDIKMGKKHWKLK